MLLFVSAGLGAT